ncbi:hypothetical protein APTSU1_000341000 [Apodemus speciosus]|uniref:Uncharacterized protein n=1 Tax=Apodemus speciosus TaxID=105296 RepID=A0ABQ0EMP4_APOSI
MVGVQGTRYMCQEVKLIQCPAEKAGEIYRVKSSHLPHSSEESKKPWFKLRLNRNRLTLSYDKRANKKLKEQPGHK